MFCGGCFRDNALVAALRQQGHQVTMVPLYLPLTLEDEDQSRGTPIFFGGISVYLEQKSSFFRKAPRWMHRLLSSPLLLKLASSSAAKTRPEDVGELTLSMLRGEEGHQARELDELIGWLAESEKPEVIVLSNALLAGMARRLGQQFQVPIICSLQGEASFLDNLPESVRSQAWETLSERCQDVDLFIAPSFYFSGQMGRRLHLPDEKLKVIPNGINLEGYPTGETARPMKPPVLGYLARMCADKGLNLLVDAFISLRQRGKIPGLRLKVAGSCGPTDEPFVQEQKTKLKKAKLLGDAEFRPNLLREQKIEFLRSLTVFSVPALYGEAFGLYVLEALAAGVPVVQPNHGAFPELIRSAVGGVLCEPDINGLVTALENLLLEANRIQWLGEAGRKMVHEKFSARRMAGDLSQMYRWAIQSREKVGTK